MMEGINQEALAHHRRSVSVSNDSEDDESSTAGSTLGDSHLDDASGGLSMDASTKYSTCFQIWCSPDHPLISRELQDMSRENRELVWADLSGNRKGSAFYHEPTDNIKESPENVERAMRELEQEIQRLPTFTLLRQVEQKHPSYVNSASFRIQFLRCERFNAKEATKRMMRYFEEKRLLWGEDCLGRRITIQDLNETDLECLKSGPHSILPGMDSCGRRVYLTNAGALGWVSKARSLLRANWYMVMKTLEEDEDVQKMGLVRLGYFLNIGLASTTLVGKLKLFNLPVCQKIAQLEQILPIRFSAFYFVFEPDRWWEAGVNAFLKFISRSVLVRTRFLTGSYQECMYQLACLGIHPFPMREDGTKDMTQRLNWIEKCLEEEGSRKRQKREGDYHMIGEDHSLVAS